MSRGTHVKIWRVWFVSRRSTHARRLQRRSPSRANPATIRRWPPHWQSLTAREADHPKECHHHEYHTDACQVRSPKDRADGLSAGQREAKSGTISLFYSDAADVTALVFTLPTWYFVPERCVSPALQNGV
jgi:hypothetical protein